MRKEYVIGEMARGRNCAQCVLGLFAEELGYDMEETDRIARCFGSGMQMGQTCGAVTGALIAIGMLDGEKEQAQEFERRFLERFGSCVCRELLGGVTSAEARESGKQLEVCPECICAAAEFVAEIMEDKL